MPKPGQIKIFKIEVSNGGGLNNRLEPDAEVDVIVSTKKEVEDYRKQVKADKLKLYKGKEINGKIIESVIITLHTKHYNYGDD